MSDVMARESAHTSGLYQKRDVALVRGDGARVWDDTGREYIDCVGGQGSGNLGHANAAVAEALATQARTLSFCTELFYNDRRAELYDRLARILPPSLDRLFLCNSGTEAVEGALKFARLATKRTHVTATMRGFHGKTMGAIAFSRALGELPKRSHSTTFGGNPLACAAAVATIDEHLRLGLARNAAERGKQLHDGLAAIASPKIREVRGLGLIQGIELKENAGPTLKALQDRGVLALGAGPTVVRYLPPLVISAAQIDAVIDATRAALS